MKEARVLASKAKVETVPSVERTVRILDKVTVNFSAMYRDKGFVPWLLVTVLLLVTPSVTAQLQCYTCVGCDVYNPTQDESCPVECGVWISTDGGTTTVNRGCVENAKEDDTLYQRCDTELCNTADVVRCFRCVSLDVAECADVVCPVEGDQCYLNPTDGHRGCTSDPEYSNDCSPDEGSNTCSLCTTIDGQTCNGNLRCVVCDTAVNPSCLEDDSFVQRCPSSDDRCYRYLDAESALHFGCTSDSKYEANCNDQFNCRTCNNDGCNRDDKFACYTCSDCGVIDENIHLTFECNIFESDQCFMGYDWLQKQTYRGCAYDGMLPFDVLDTCTEDGCNDVAFPSHRQCSQCTGCDLISPTDVNYCRDVTATGCFMMLMDTDGGGTTLVRGCNTDEEYSDCQENRNCATCSEDQCNGGARTAAIFCSHCNGVLECSQQNVPFSCQDTSFTNQCFMYANGDGELVKGCLLDLEPTSEIADACYDPSDPRCTLCKGFECNRQHCVRCDSRTDGFACLLADEEWPLPYVLCAGTCRVEVDAEGHTVRGCSDDFTNPCDQNSCAETLQPGSNVGLYPLNRRQCYRCEGDQCQEEQRPEDGQYCLLHRGVGDGCYIYNDGSTVVRGCTTDPGARCTESTDDPFCEVWTESLTNGQGLALMSCYQDCPGAGSEVIPSCPPINCTPENDRCFLSVSTSGVISRGCTTISGCPPDSRDCFICREPNCNGAQAVCATCDTEIDSDCTVGEEHGDICEQTAGCFQYQEGDREIYGCAELAPVGCSDDAAHCLLCDELFCNVKALTTCWSCTDCPDVLFPRIQDTQICSTDGDHCFTGLIGSRIDRGCRSEMPNPIEDYIVIEDCTTRTCNGLSRADWVQCYECVDCPDEPNEAMSTVCVNPPTNECFTWRDTEGLIHRGCAVGTGLDVCDNGINCEVCETDNCNDRVVYGAPPGAQEFACVQCTGNSDCVDYNTVSRCTNVLGVLFDGCVTYNNGTAVQKGCLSDVELFPLCSGGANPEQCDVSWQPRGNARAIQCITCQNGIECVRGDAGEMQIPTYDQGSCVTFINDDGMVERGNSVRLHECRGSPLCVECFTDACNEGLFPEDRLLCYQCNGDECSRVGQTSSFSPEPCLKYDEATEKCYAWYDGASNVQRGCLLDDDVCQTPGSNCHRCDSEGCNDLDYAIFIDTKTCVLCGSNRECETNPSEETCSGPDGCFTFFSGLFVVAKGCVSEIDEGALWYDECTSESQGCLRCFGDRCNSNQCFACNSSVAGGADCIEPGIDRTQSTACPTSEVCVAFIDDGGNTVRGCLEDYPEQVTECSEDPSTCLQCSGDHCNRGVLPRDRLKCHQCAGSDEDCLAPAQGSERYCAIYREGEESCYTHFEDETTVERGCTLQRTDPCEGSCRTCNTTSCNDQRALIDNPLSCAQCSGEECEETSSVTVVPCPEKLLFGQLDQCYTYFGPDGSVVERGCLSELTKAGGTVATQCQDTSDDSCQLCSPNGCNARSVKCFVCDSTTDPGCGDVLSEITGNMKQCGTGQCVSLVDGTVTRKGCAEDFEAECNSGTRCRQFDGALSNGGVFPEDRLRCYQCAGTSASCGQIQPSTPLGTCQLYEPEDECYTYVSDAGDTFRGCLSDRENTHRCTEDPDYCVRCASVHGCNNEPSAQPNQLICAQCNSAKGCTETSEFRRCNQQVLLGRQDSCYTHSFAGEVLSRGCLSDADQLVRDKCSSASGNECAVCQCDRCNGPPVQCVSCAGETGCGDTGGVGVDLTQCKSGTCVSFVTHLPNGSSTVTKGCSESYETDVCGAHPSNGGKFQLCHSSRCNDVLFPEDRLKCYQCEGDSCADRALVPVICEPYREGDRCYSFLNRQEKGCLGQLEDPQECVGDGSLCQVCDSADGCNMEPRPLECTACTSKSDPRCIDPKVSGKAKKLCPIGGCTTFIDVEGSTVKGCAADYGLTAATCSTSGGANCLVCSDGDSCNDVLFPTARLQCFQCSGPACLDVALLEPTFCSKFDTTDACYTYASGPTSIERGCLSDRASECPKECVTCSDAGGCNNDPPVVANTLTCHRCEGVGCADERDGTGTDCPAVLLGHTDACYSFVETHTVRRGCLSEDGACDPTEPNCHVCTEGNDCNSERYSVIIHGCIRCTEDDMGQPCKWGFAQTEALQCPETASAGSGCYTCYGVPEEGEPSETRDLAFQRGCVGDQWHGRCRPETLNVCLGAGCNHRNEQLQICAKCVDGCNEGRWLVEECRGAVAYERRGCYIMRDARKRTLARGCVADLDENAWQRCSNARDSTCLTCLENECNRAITGLGRMSLTTTLLVAGVAIAYALRRS